MEFPSGEYKMNNLLSPRYVMDLIDNISETLFKKYKSYKKVEQYILRWREIIEYEPCGYYDAVPIYNFEISYKEDATKNIDTINTLNSMKEELIIQMAIDLDIEVAGVIYSIAKIEGLDKPNYKQAKNIFNDAIKNVYEKPDVAIGYANSALESIIKHILEQGKIKINYNPKDTLYDLMQKILKGLDYYPTKDTPQEIRTIGSSILSISKAIESLRSEKTKFHGKDSSQYIIDDPLYASFIVNCVATLGNFLITYYESKYQILDKKETKNNSADCDFEDLNFEDEIPF